MAGTWKADLHNYETTGRWGGLVDQSPSLFFTVVLYRERSVEFAINSLFTGIELPVFSLEARGVHARQLRGCFDEKLIRYEK